MQTVTAIPTNSSGKKRKPWTNREFRVPVREDVNPIPQMWGYARADKGLPTKRAFFERLELRYLFNLRNEHPYASMQQLVDLIKIDPATRPIFHVRHVLKERIRTGLLTAASLNEQGILFKDAEPEERNTYDDNYDANDGENNVDGDEVKYDELQSNDDNDVKRQRLTPSDEPNSGGELDTD